MKSHGSLHQMDMSPGDFGTGPDFKFGSAKSINFSKHDNFDEVPDDDLRAGTSQGMRSRNNLDQRKIGTAAASTRPTLKYKQLSTLYPAAKTGSFFNSQGAYQGVESIREDKEAVENLDKWDNEFKIQMLSKNVEREKKGDEEFQADNMDIFRAPAINQEIVNIIGTDDLKQTDNKLGMGNPLKGKIRVPQKSLETIMSENNKKNLE